MEVRILLPESYQTGRRPRTPASSEARTAIRPCRCRHFRQDIQGNRKARAHVRRSRDGKKRRSPIATEGDCAGRAGMVAAHAAGDRNPGMGVGGGRSVGDEVTLTTRPLPEL